MLTLQFVPYHEVERLSSPERVNKLLKIVKDGKVILLEGALKSREEAELIRRTMEEIDDSFKGIEISPITVAEQEMAFTQRIRSMLINLLLGDRRGLTIIGPANVVKEIRKDPDKIQLLTEDSPKKRKK